MDNTTIFKKLTEGDTVYLEYYVQTAKFEGTKTVDFIEHKENTKEWKNKIVSFGEITQEAPRLVTEHGKVYVEVNSIDSPRGWTEMRELYALEFV